MPDILDTLAVAAALPATIAGAGSLYLGLPRQHYLAQPLDGRRSRRDGARWLLAAWLLWSLTLRPTTALFVVLTVCMVSFILLPILGAVTAGRGQR